MNKPVFRYFVLYGSFKSERNYRENCRFGIVARGIEQAVQIAKQLHPDTTIFDISHHGTVDVIDSDAEILVIADVENDGVTEVVGVSDDMSASSASGDTNG